MGEADKKWEDMLPSYRQKLGGRVAAVIEAVGGVKAAADIAEKSVKQLGRYVSGDSEPSLEVLARLASAAGMEIEDVLAGDRAPPAMSAGAAAGDAVRSDVLAGALAAVEELMLQRQVALLPDKKAKLVAIVYGQLTKGDGSSQIRRGEIENLLDLAS